MDLSQRKQELANELNQGQQALFQLQQRLQQIIGQLQIIEELEKENDTKSDNPEKGT